MKYHDFDNHPVLPKHLPRTEFTSAEIAEHVHLIFQVDIVYLYNDSMMEIKDLNGDVLAQLFTDINKATRFEFIDQHGTLLVANQTHMQLFSSTNKEAWLDV